MNPQRPFDLKKLDFETARLAKRRKLLLFSLPITFVIMIVCLKLLSVPLLSSVAHNSYKSSQYDSANQWLFPLYIANWMEPYKLLFNHGNALYKQGDYQAAEGRYREALETVPEKQECSVRINLALSIEAQADALIAKKSYDNAVILYDDMKAVLYDGEDSCGVRFNEVSATDEDSNGDDSSDSGQSEKLMKRAQEKSNSAKRLRNNDGPSTDSNSDNTVDNGSVEERLEKLEQKSQQFQIDRAKEKEEYQRGDDIEKDDKSYGSKSW